MNKQPFRPLHPTDKECKCGFVGTRTQFYKHLAFEQPKYGSNHKAFFHSHGEVPHYVNSPVS